MPFEFQAQHHTQENNRQASVVEFQSHYKQIYEHFYLSKYDLQVELNPIIILKMPTVLPLIRILDSDDP